MAEKVLVVDDSDDLRYTVIYGLRAIGSEYEFYEAENGLICLQMLKEGLRPDLILLDIMMPKMDGWDVAAHLKVDARWRDIPIIFLTAKDDDMSKGMGGITGRDYVVKPFDMEDLDSRVKEALSDHSD
ncbi:MAG: response regulator [Nanoarchaeota archaeon]